MAWYMGQVGRKMASRSLPTKAILWPALSGPGPSSELTTLPHHVFLLLPDPSAFSSPSPASATVTEWNLLPWMPEQSALGVSRSN